MAIARAARSFAHDLARIYPPDRVLTGPAALAAYQSDALTAFESRPMAVVLPETEAEVIETVRLCHRQKVPFVARGSGTSLSGGSLPVEEGIVVGLNRLDRILRLDPLRRACVVEPGAWNLQVTRAAAPFGLLYAPDPSSQQICSIGGNVAFNSGGAHCLKYGMTANHVLGLTAVLPDGEVVTLGSESFADAGGFDQDGRSRDATHATGHAERTRRAAATAGHSPPEPAIGSLESIGPNWTGLFVGSEGLFGIALEIALRLVPRPERYHTVLAAYHSLEAAGTAVSRIVASGLPPGAIEMMDRLAMDAAEAAVHAGYPPEAAAALIVELEGPREEVEAEIPLLDRLIADSGAFRVQVARGEGERAAIWKGRKSAFSAAGRLSSDYIVQDGVVPRSKLGPALAEIDRLGGAYGLRVANVFHAGDGNLHPLILFDGREPGALRRAEELAAEILRLCIRLGGSITGEHGVGMEKRAFLPEMFGPADMATMRRLARAIDPLGLANPGKMLVPDDQSPTAPIPDRPVAVGPVAGEPVADQPGRSGAASPTAAARPESLAELGELVRTIPCVVARGGGTKPALSTPPPGATALDVSGLAGIVEYDPDELTVTARAGTRLADLEAALAEHGQYLAFDPPFVEAGATVGGAVAAGLSGPGRWRYGGIRDFILQVVYVDGRGELVRGGAKVVKNAAGFDIPRVMAGSLGRFGVLAEVTFKVLPASEAHATVRLDYADLAAAIAAMQAVSIAPLELEAIDLVTALGATDGAESGASLWLRVGGLERAIDRRAERVLEAAARSNPVSATEVLRGQADVDAWLAAREISWAPEGFALLDVPVTPARITAFEAALDGSGAMRRYAAAGSQLYLAWPSPALDSLEPILRNLGLGALVIRGDAPRPLLGVAGHAFGSRVKAGLDPDRRFPGL